MDYRITPQTDERIKNHMRSHARMLYTKELQIM